MQQFRWATAALAVGAGQMAAGCSGPSAPAPRYDAATFYETVSISGAAFSHDEQRLLISTDETGVFNAYSQPFDGGAPRQLTRSEGDSVFGVSWFPQDDRFLYTADQGGNELNHLYVQERDGSYRDLTPGKGLKARFLGWSGDRASFWVATNERDPLFFDLYRYRTEGYERELVLRNEGGWNVSAVSRDGRWVALGKPRSNADSDIYIWDAQRPDQAPVHVTAHLGNVQHIPLTFSPDGGKLYYLTDGHGEFTQAWAYDLQSRTREVAVQAAWDVVFLYFSETGRYRITGVNHDAQTRVTILEPGLARSCSYRAFRQGTSAVSSSPAARRGWPSTSAATLPRGTCTWPRSSICSRVVSPTASPPPSTRRSW